MDLPYRRLNISMRRHACIAVASFLFSQVWVLPAQALGQKPLLNFDPAQASVSNGNSVALAQNGKAASLLIDPADHAGVIRAAGDLQADIERVSGVRPVLLTSVDVTASDVVIIGTLGNSAVLDKLVKSGALDVSSIAGKWEGWLVQTLISPLPGIERALVIAGSDKRGTIFGIYEISEQIGVSPWAWWADVPPAQHSTILVPAATKLSDAPVVQYRGIFLNDEQPALSGWVKQHYGSYNHQFYEKVFELILRMRGNYLWPAMWGSAFFDDDKLNGQRANEYGIVIGTSHHEPMMRAQQEWQRHGGGPWDYSKNTTVLQNYWRGALRNTKDVEKVITLGMRGDGDEPMSRDANVALLERIVRDQRSIIASDAVADITADISKVPQVWALYKEVQDYYEKGMRVPDDVILLWCDDNWGNIRRLPTAAERKRAGGAGVYYHFDYVGGPRSYKWLNVTPIPKIWEQMQLAWQYQAKRLWIVNVGDLKPMEVPIEFFLSYAWNPAAWPAERLPEYLRLWATREFGAEYAAEIADIVARYSKYNGRRKPEMLEPDTYSLHNYREAERVVAQYQEIAARAEKISAALPLAQRDAFFQLVLYPVKAGAVVNDLYVTAALNRLYATQGRAATNLLAARARALFSQDAELTRQYHEDISGGKWNHMMSQTHLGYTSWDQPSRNVMPAVSEIQLPLAAEMGVTAEGSQQIWPSRGVTQLTLPAFDVFDVKSDASPKFLEIFNRGQHGFDFNIRASEPWVILSQTKGTIKPEQAQQRIMVDVNWAQVPIGNSQATLSVGGPNGSQVVVQLNLHNPASLRPENAVGFVETQGVIAIEAEHYSRALAPPQHQWQRIPDHGRTLSGMTARSPDAADATAAHSLADGMRLEYAVNLFNAGKLSVQTTLAPTLNFQAGKGLSYAISFDDEAPQVINIHKDTSQAAWERSVADGAVVFSTEHLVQRPGVHTLKFWALDTGLVVQKLVVNAGGLQPSYLGPPESPRF